MQKNICYFELYKKMTFSGTLQATAVDRAATDSHKLDRLIEVRGLREGIQCRRLSQFIVTSLDVTTFER